jgi:hypothetical protein
LELDAEVTFQIMHGSWIIRKDFGVSKRGRIAGDVVVEIVPQCGWFGWAMGDIETNY